MQSCLASMPKDLPDSWGENKRDRSDFPRLQDTQTLLRLWQIVSACFEVHTITHNLCDIILRTNPVRVYGVYRIIGYDDAGRAFKTGSCFTANAYEKEVLLLTITTLMRQSL